MTWNTISFSKETDNTQIINDSTFATTIIFKNNSVQSLKISTFFSSPSSNYNYTYTTDVIYYESEIKTIKASFYGYITFGTEVNKNNALKDTYKLYNNYLFPKMSTSVQFKSLFGKDKFTFNKLNNNNLISIKFHTKSNNSKGINLKEGPINKNINIGEFVTIAYSLKDCECECEC